MTGIPVLAAMADLTITAAAVGSLAFIPGDILKVIICALIARTVDRFQPESLLSRS